MNKLEPSGHSPGRRRTLLAAALASIVAVAADAGDQPAMTVWKSPDCGCCKDWMAHIEAAGIRVAANDTGNNAARAPGYALPFWIVSYSRNPGLRD